MSGHYLLLLGLFIESGFILGAIGLLFGARKHSVDIKKERKLKFLTYFIIVHTVLCTIWCGTVAFTVLLCMIIAFSGYELTKVSLHATRHSYRTVIAFLVYGTCAVFCIRAALQFDTGTLLYCYLIVAVLDAYAQIAGQLFGKRPLAPAISPNKTIEGALGGTGAAMVTAIVFHSLVGLTIPQSLIAGSISVTGGIGGDLLASSYKRYTGVRDYSTLLPGQGGFIDRFNSLFVAMPLLYAIISLYR